MRIEEKFHITIEYINRKNKSEGYAIYCHSNINGIGMEFYEKSITVPIKLIKDKYKIEEIIDYTKKNYKE